MGCGEFLVKYILFFTNLVFALAGLALLGVGIAVQFKITAVVNLLDGNLQSIPITSMVVGGIVFLIAFFGCCGAIKESNCMLVTYSIIMLLLMAVKIALAVIIFVQMDTMVAQIPEWLGKQFSDQESYREIESMFQCCGVSGPQSYVVNLPDTCCAAPPCNILKENYPGCSPVLQGFFQTFGMVIGVLAITVVAVELVAAVFGLCLANHVRNKYRRARY